MWYWAVYSFTIKALIYGPFDNKYLHMVYNFWATYFITFSKCWLRQIKCQSHPELWHLITALPSIEPWHIPSGQQTPTWTSWNSTDFTQRPFEDVQDPVFAQCCYRNAQSALHHSSTRHVHVYKKGCVDSINLSHSGITFHIPIHGHFSHW